jgi:hypothetical protein
MSKAEVHLAASQNNPFCKDVLMSVYQLWELFKETMKFAF